MPWRKLGLLFAPENRASWYTSHAALPVAEFLGGDVFRVYFSGRDSQSRARIGYFLLDLDRREVIEVSAKSILPLGAMGSFDDHGTTMACLANHQGRRYLYYSGWHLGVTVPFYFFIGLAVSEDAHSDFQRVHDAPVLGRSRRDPYLTASPSIMIDSGRWRMWYVSCLRWVMENNSPKHYYHVRYAESADGITWEPHDGVCIDFASPDEYAIGRPHVLKDGGIYKMWYSRRGAAYRLGYAESADGITWERKDHLAGLDVSESGWDSEMVAYPHVFDHAGARYMLYNGNGYGKTGIGWAVWE